MQTTPYIPQLPENIQEQVNLAMQKVSALREDEIKLNKQKVETEKDVARLEITRDTLNAELPKLELAVNNAQDQLDSVEEAVKKAKAELNEIEQSQRLAQKELEEAQANTSLEATRLTTIVEKAKEVETIIEAEKQALEAEKEAFNQRKKTIQELLTSL